GGLMCMGYSTMRGFAVAHGTIGELRVGQVPVRVVDARGRRRYLGKIRVNECEMVGRATQKRKKKGPPYLSVGYGLCFGQKPRPFVWEWSRAPCARLASKYRLFRIPKRRTSASS